MPSNNNDTAKDLKRLVEANDDIAGGTAGARQQNGTVNVAGRNCVAATDMSPGEPTLVVRDRNTNQDYAFQGNKQGVEAETNVLYRRGRTEEEAGCNKIKYLVAKTLQEENKVEFYVGGDRRTPSKIFECHYQETVTLADGNEQTRYVVGSHAWLTNLGIGKNNFLVGIITFENWEVQKIETSDPDPDTGNGLIYSLSFPNYNKFPIGALEPTYEPVLDKEYIVPTKCTAHLFKGNETKSFSIPNPPHYQANYHKQSSYATDGQNPDSDRSGINEQPQEYSAKIPRHHPSYLFAWRGWGFALSVPTNHTIEQGEIATYQGYNNNYGHYYFHRSYVSSETQTITQKEIAFSWDKLIEYDSTETYIHNFSVDPLNVDPANDWHRATVTIDFSSSFTAILEPEFIIIQSCSYNTSLYENGLIPLPINPSNVEEYETTNMDLSNIIASETGISDQSLFYSFFLRSADVSQQKNSLYMMMSDISINVESEESVTDLAQAINDALNDNKQKYYQGETFVDVPDGVVFSVFDGSQYSSGASLFGDRRYIIEDRNYNPKRIKNNAKVYTNIFPTTSHTLEEWNNFKAWSKVNPRTVCYYPFRDQGEGTLIAIQYHP